MKTARRVFRILNLALRTLITALVVLLAVYNGYMLVQKYAYGNDMPTVFGYASAVVVTGSMDTGESSSDIRINDMVVVRSQKEYAVGDVITFRDRQGDYTTHRIVRTQESGGETQYITRGDANDADDPYAVSEEDIVGKVVCVLRGVGAAVSFLQTPAGLFTVIACGAGVWLLTAGIAAAVERGKRKRGGETAEETENRDDEE